MLVSKRKVGAREFWPWTIRRPALVLLTGTWTSLSQVVPVTVPSTCATSGCRLTETGSASSGWKGSKTAPAAWPPLLARATPPCPPPRRQSEAAEGRLRWPPHPRRKTAVRLPSRRQWQWNTRITHLVRVKVSHAQLVHGHWAELRSKRCLQPTLKSFVNYRKCSEGGRVTLCYVFTDEKSVSKQVF